ncbi:MAG: UDP-N-acetylmuramate dehydrogenase [Mycobacteriales bacterium]
MSEAAVAAMARVLAGAGLAVERDRPLGPFTTFGLGGPAAIFLSVPDLGTLQAALRVIGGADPAAVPMMMVGKGSNLLVSDSGFPGVVLRLAAGFKWLRRDGAVVGAGAAEAMPAVAAWTAREGLAGLEFAAGIPATVGGSVRMNAGAHGGETGTLLLDADVATPAGIERLPREALDFGYRRARLPERSVVVAARWLLRPDDPVAIRARLDGLRAWRRATQPLRQRNCGSVFTNPPGDSAGRLIERAGLKGYQVGGARVSDKHANFIVVDPAARAADVHWLICHIRRVIHDGGGPLLEPEVRLVGSFPAPGGP